MKKLFFLIVLIMGISAPSFRLAAEIETITIKWIALECLAPSVQNLTQRFLTLPGTAEILMDGQQGQAVIRWKPFVPFTFDYINSAMRMAGPRIKDIRIKVRGTIVRSGNSIVIRSLGDNTQFVLLSPARASPTQYVPQESIQTHILAPETAQRLLEAERDSVVTVIEGPLFEPTRQLGLNLIVEQATFIRLGQG